MRRSAAVKTAIDSKLVAIKAANAAEAKKAHGTVVLDVRQVTLMADYFVIAGGDSANQVRAIVESIIETLGEIGYKHEAVEGKQDGRWVLLDYGDVIIHVLQGRERNYYKLEQFWNQALIIPKGEWVEENWVND